jgi:hypothetical protein
VTAQDVFVTLISVFASTAFCFICPIIEKKSGHYVVRSNPECQLLDIKEKIDTAIFE